MLSDTGVNKLDQQVSLGLNELTFLQVAANKVVSNLRVVQLGGASLGLGFIEELEEPVAVLTFGLLVDVDDSLEDVVPEPFDMLV